MKIYIFALQTTNGLIDCVGGYALCEDGKCILRHTSSTFEAIKDYMGVKSKNIRHMLYSAHCPNGYELEWVDFENLKQNYGFLNALICNHKEFLKKGAETGIWY